MADMRKILILDCAMNGCVAAVYDAGDGACYEERFETARGQAEKLVPMVQDALAKAGFGFDALDAIIVTLGPGTFTGIRIGISAAKAFALALGIPLYGVSTLQVLALDYGDAVSVVLETKRQDFYVQRFDADASALDTAQSLNAEDIDTSGVFIGDALERFEGALDGVAVHGEPSVCSVRGAVIGRAFMDASKRAAFFTQEISPIYLRAPDVSFPKVAPRRIAE